ncbi:hypothetical protein ACFV2X_44235 [Streptomyces sp. NPDC059679]|uniref:hypothetical protein n=1 Tax=Streptomyces sp. NPDC059679 TaxID=3346903 RepID=UPI0036A81600
MRARGGHPLRHRRAPPPSPAGTPSVTGEDARAALSMALAAIRSIITAGPVRIDELQDR